MKSCRLAVVLLTLGGSIVGCNSQKAISEEANGNIVKGPSGPATFKEKEEYARLDATFQKLSADDAESILGKPFRLNGTILSDEEVNAFVLREKRIAAQTSKIEYKLLSCTREADRMYCAVSVRRTSSDKRLPTTGYAVTHTKRKDEWKWDGMVWRLHGSMTTDEMISD